MIPGYDVVPISTLPECLPVRETIQPSPGHIKSASAHTLTDLITGKQTLVNRRSKCLGRWTAKNTVLILFWVSALWVSYTAKRVGVEGCGTVFSTEILLAFMTVLNGMARRRSALPVISEPMLGPAGHITTLLEEESRRRNSTNSIHLVSNV